MLLSCSYSKCFPLFDWRGALWKRTNRPIERRLCPPTAVLTRGTEGGSSMFRVGWTAVSMFSWFFVWSTASFGRGWRQASASRARVMFAWWVVNIGIVNCNVVRLEVDDVACVNDHEHDIRRKKGHWKHVLVEINHQLIFMFMGDFQGLTQLLSSALKFSVGAGAGPS